MPVMQNLELRLIADFFGQDKFFVKRRKQGVPRHLSFDERQVKVRTTGQGLLINLRAPADEDVVGKLLGIQPVQRVKNQNLGPLVFLQFGKVKLVGALEITSAAPFVVLAENLRMRLDEPLRMPRKNHVFRSE